MPLILQAAWLQLQRFCPLRLNIDLLFPDLRGVVSGHEVTQEYVDGVLLISVANILHVSLNINLSVLELRSERPLALSLKENLLMSMATSILEGQRITQVDILIHELHGHAAVGLK